MGSLRLEEHSKPPNPRLVWVVMLRGFGLLVFLVLYLRSLGLSDPFKGPEPEGFLGP